MTYTTILKNEKLRYNEYYNQQKIFDSLYKNSLEGKIFSNLYDLIISENNIKLAYRNIKSNTGSKTKGTDGKTIKDYSHLSEKFLINRIRNRLRNYKPSPIRRVEIPKPNGKTRPLGIPTMEDRLIQQCFKQILEPICEAKFHKHSYGFRPNRKASNAIFRMQSFVNHANMHYCVDIDIKGFFDNISHSKLLKQLWTLGIRDKKVISIISKMLKAEVEGYGVQTKGTPQGGILSPLLSNVVLNELDWWISSQWETMKTVKTYTNNNQYRALKKTKLKEVFLVRYADDFKIFCRDYKTAQKMFCATKDWIKQRLGLEISHEKSKITNLRKNYSEFLGFKLKAEKKYKTENNVKKEYFAVKSHVANKGMKKMYTDLKEAVKSLQKDLSHGNVGYLNSMILGYQNYYCVATHVSKDMYKLEYLFNRTLYNRLKKHLKVKPKGKNKMLNTRYKDYNGKIYWLSDMPIYPISECNNIFPYAFNQLICNYTEEGRKKIHNNLSPYISSCINYLVRYPLRNESIELNDNRISKFSAQKGRCAISGEILEMNGFDVHHIKMKNDGGTDQYNNLICVTKTVHKLIHATNKDTIEAYMKSLNLGAKELVKLNEYRLKVGNLAI